MPATNGADVIAVSTAMFSDFAAIHAAVGDVRTVQNTTIAGLLVDDFRFL